MATNLAFWDELCGSRAARQLGVTDASPTSLATFDRWFFGFYPYLARHISFERLRGKRVLEVGLGYSSVSQRLAESDAIYSGLDIAMGPVEMVRHRLRQIGVSCDVRQGSVLECPWPDGSFDHVVAIGCYHHTGDLARAIAETRRVLRPGGGATIMVYSAYSWRRWRRWPGATARALVAELRGHAAEATTAAQRAAYDRNTKGEAAPETVFTSARALRRMMADWSHVRITRENMDGGRIPRRWLLPIGRLVGLDLYITARR